MNSKLRKKVESNIEKEFFKSMNNGAFGKTVENVRKYRNIKLATTERRRNYVVSEPNYHTTKFYHTHRRFISNRNEKNSNTNK